MYPLGPISTLLPDDPTSPADEELDRLVSEMRAQLLRPRLFAGIELVMLFLSIPVVLIYLVSYLYSL